MLNDLKALKFDSVVDTASSLAQSPGGPAPPPAAAADSTEHVPTATPAFVKENFKSKIMKKSIDDLLHDQNSVDQLIGGAANEFVEVDQETLQK